MFYLFVGDDYYPSGGWKDYHSSFDSFEAAKFFGLGIMACDSLKWFHIVDAKTLEVIYDSKKV